MPDLANTAVQNWLAQKDRPLSNSLRGATRRIDHDPGVDTALTALGVALDQAHTLDPNGFLERLKADPAKTQLITLLAQIGGARAVRILDWLCASALPAEPSFLASFFAASSGDAGAALQTAMRAMNRRALIQRMLAPERLIALKAACNAART